MPGQVGNRPARTGGNRHREVGRADHIVEAGRFASDGSVIVEHAPNATRQVRFYSSHVRTFEMALVAALLVFVWWSAGTGRARRPVADVVGLLGIGGVTATQLLLEGYRWQLVPIYLAAGLVGVVALWDLASPADREPDRRRSVTAALWGTVGLAVATMPAVALPVVQISPSVAAPIGTLSDAVVDSSRVELYGPEPGGAREIALQVWYPASTTDGAIRAGLVDGNESLARTAADYLGFPPFALDHIELIETNSFAAAPAANDRLPVVIYSHGWGGFRTVALNQMEALAGNGFVVVAIDHTHASLSVTLGDGEARLIDLDALPDEEDVSPEDYVAAREVLSLTFSEDIWFVLDLLESIEQGDIAALSPLAGRLDLDHIGLLGHSTGGGAVVTACADDVRCDAVLGQDPWLEPVPGEILREGLAVPFLALRSEQWLERDNDALVREFITRSGGQAAGAYVARTVHRDFTILPALSPLSDVAGLSGPLDNTRTFELVEAVTVAFFDEHLRNGPSFRQRLAGFGELVFDT